MKEAEERGKQTQDVSSLREDFRDLVFPWDVAKYKEVVRSLPQGMALQHLMLQQILSVAH